MYITQTLTSLHFTTIFIPNSIQYTSHKHSPVCTLLQFSTQSQSNIQHTNAQQSAIYYNFHPKLNPIYSTQTLTSLPFTTIFIPNSIQYTAHKHSPVCTLLQFSSQTKSNIHHTNTHQSALYYNFHPKLNPIYITQTLTSLYFTTIFIPNSIQYTPHKHSQVCTLLQFSSQTQSNIHYKHSPVCTLVQFSTQTQSNIHHTNTHQSALY